MFILHDIVQRIGNGTYSLHGQQAPIPGVTINR